MIYLLIRLDQPVQGLTESSRTILGYSLSVNDAGYAASEADKNSSEHCYTGWNGETFPKFVVQELQALPDAPKPVISSRVPDSDNQSDEYDCEIEEEEEIVWPFRYRSQ